MYVLMAKVYEDLDALVSTNSLRFNFNNGFKWYKIILVIQNLFQLIMCYSRNEFNLIHTTQVNRTWVGRKVTNVLKLT
jgi:hypothetical protein